MESKGKSIELIGFREELLASGRKLLHCVFEEKFGTFRYTWTPAWKGESGVERLFFKALEIEEWNDYEGAWSKELKQASQEIPSLEEIRLPVKIRLSEMAELAGHRDHGTEQPLYRFAVEILDDEEPARTEELGKKLLMCIGKAKISYDSLASFLTKQTRISGVSGGIQRVFIGDWPYEQEAGVRFYVWIQAGLQKSEYQVIGKEIVFHLRSFIRKRLSDYQAFKRGFEEL